MVRAGLVALAVLTLAVPAADAQPARFDKAALNAQIQSQLAEHGESISASIWLGGADGEAWFARDVDTPWPTASAIKTFYLVELFAAHAARLDAPLAGTAAVLNDDAHPAVSHFTPDQRDEIRKGLRGASVRQVGLVMMGTAPASNIVYNAAANLTTAVLGGPEALSARIRGRDPAFAEVAARRYMLRDRTERGDNEAPASALAALYQRLASKKLRGIDAATVDAIRKAAQRADDAEFGAHFDKGGSLPSDPLAEVRAGWYETPKGPLVYVVMTSQPGPGPSGRDASSTKLIGTADALATAVVSAGWTAIR
jgi:hypothetical protein